MYLEYNLISKIQILSCIWLPKIIIVLPTAEVQEVAD